MSKGEKNSYTCQKCGGVIVTIDVDDGVTPFMLACRATPGCNGVMRSGFYVAVDQSAEPDYEWFKPSSLKGYNREMREHIKKGGLDIRNAAEHRVQSDDASRCPVCGGVHKAPSFLCPNVSVQPHRR
jgi:ssDNA-binding Zn-finger/Zn-ribbon topoisomerase 1